MSRPIPWLPDTALCDARTATPVARAAAEWSAAWLAADALVVSPRWERCGEPAERSAIDGFALHLEHDAKPGFAALLLGRDADSSQARTEHDHLLIERLVSAAIAALRETLDRVLSGAGDTGCPWFVLAVIGSDGTPLLRVEACRSVLVALAGEWAGPRRSTARPSARHGSLADQPLALAARIGTSRLALSEIEAIGVGDVLTLDTDVSAPIGACIDGRLASDEALLLTLDEGAVQLKIERPASQW